jgi:hypothetical protein
VSFEYPKWYVNIHRTGVVRLDSATSGEWVRSVFDGPMDERSVAMILSGSNEVTEQEAMAVMHDIDMNRRRVAELEEDFYANSKGGAQLVGVMVIAAISGVFGGLIGFFIGRL